ncbi:MAG TPA: RDD family protein [Anaeromyxobacter sp.]|nr:RDD family protein [Anaeromyxobacter sp.]
MVRGPALELETPERVAVTLELAGVGSRAFAWLADAFCVFLVGVAALLAYSISGDLVRDVQALSWVGQLLALALVFLMGWGWDVAWETLAGGVTPGKRLAGIRVVRTDGGPPGLAESLVRNLLRSVELPLGYAPAILAVALGPRRQRLGDLVAGTLVVRQERFDLSRYDVPAAPAAAGFTSLRGRVGAALGTEGFERVVDFLRRRPELDPTARSRVAARLAKSLASRLGTAAPPAGDAEAFLEALAAFHAEGR